MIGKRGHFRFTFLCDESDNPPPPPPPSPPPPSPPPPISPGPIPAGTPAYRIYWLVWCGIVGRMGGWIIGRRGEDLRGDYWVISNIVRL
ncbi:hypothetical protein BO71DRAFT_402736 [Aspergillus ellipticus CBS 707.79]|uniref:Uncharacterized protein n=1 Tax=Aspergillus ellipticus CBS 707.79 TaxID=1448320 RepID=A0A319CXK2_9EURO|nr:hypothetical protein BO71DRAFT_402736 [Aspergillus ellipticus CBS 707.79]